MGHSQSVVALTIMTRGLSPHSHVFCGTWWEENERKVKATPQRRPEGKAIKNEICMARDTYGNNYELFSCLTL